MGFLEGSDSKIMRIAAYWKKQAFEAELLAGQTADGNFEVVVTLPGNKTVTGHGATYFEAIKQIRGRIEPHEWLLGINASRIDAGVLPESATDIDTITVIEDEEAVMVYTLGDAEQTKLASLDYQEKFFNEKVRQLEIIEQAKIKAQEPPRPLRLKTAAPTKRTAIISTVLTLISAIYPLSFFWIPQDIEYIGLWGIFGLLIYGSIIAINIENVVIRGKSSFSLTFSITAPLIIGLVVWYLHTSELINALWTALPFLKP